MVAPSMSMPMIFIRTWRVSFGGNGKVRASRKVPRFDRLSKCEPSEPSERRIYSLDLLQINRAHLPSSGKDHLATATTGANRRPGKRLERDGQARRDPACGTHAALEPSPDGYAGSSPFDPIQRNAWPDFDIR